MFKLNDLQTHFQDHLLDRSLVSHKLHEQIEGRLDIYYEAYRLRLLEALTVNYTKSQILIDDLLGADHFETLGLAYIQQYPSQHFSVRYFGQHFSVFLKQALPYSKVPYLSELAHFEWAALHSLDAADSPLLTLSDLKNISPEQWGDLTFSFHPSVQCQTYQWDIPTLWKSMDAPSPFIKNEHPTTCLFWRKNLKSLFETLPLTHQIFYQGIIANKSFGELCEDLFEITPEDQYASVPATAVGILQYWIEQGVISSLA